MSDELGTSPLTESDFEPDAVLKRADRLKIGMVTYEHGVVRSIGPPCGGLVYLAFPSAHISVVISKLFTVVVPRAQPEDADTSTGDVSQPSETGDISQIVQ